VLQFKQFTPKKIVVIQTAFLGDTILITPLLRALNEQYPSALLDVVVIPQTAGILANNPRINRLLLFDKRKNKQQAMRELIQVLRESEYDIAISPHKSLTSGLLLYYSRIPVRIGFDKGLASVFLTHRVPYRRNLNEIQRNLHLLSILSSGSKSLQTEIYPGFRNESKVNDVLRLINRTGRIKIALAPGSVWPTKRWPMEYFAELTDMLVRDGFDLFFIGSADERALCQKIIDKSGSHNTINLAGITDLLTSAALIRHCDLMICNDSGAMHIANAMKTDVVAFFGPTVRSFGFYPFRENDLVMEVELNCRPCGRHGGRKCPAKHFRCMREIKPESVYREIKKHLERKQSLRQNVVSEF
jgi:heptosyltransferase-2